MHALARLFKLWRPPEPTPEPNGFTLIDRVDLTIEARCPCGSAHAHVLTLHSHADCPRCGRTYAIRSLAYFRRSPDQMPDLQVTIGYVVRTEFLTKAAPVGGVH